ncbi:MAG: Maf family protein [Chitinophagaceae bacterium]|nr:Maf family protein [Anaerolineae bacterium]
MRFVLASGSPRRRELIGSLGISFEVIKPDIDETQQPDEGNLAYVTRLCQEKAAAVMSQLHPPATVLAADTIVVLAADTIGVISAENDLNGVYSLEAASAFRLNGELLGKPRDAEEARRMLQRLRNRPHTVCTAFTLLQAETALTPAKKITSFVCTTVHMRDYSADEIEAYIATGDPFDKAGSYAIQHEGFHPVAQIDGCYNNVVGLPLCVVKRGLVYFGWSGITATADCDCKTFAD